MFRRIKIPVGYHTELWSLQPTNWKHEVTKTTNNSNLKQDRNRQDRNYHYTPELWVHVEIQEAHQCSDRTQLLHPSCCCQHEASLTRSVTSRRTQRRSSFRWRTGAFITHTHTKIGQSINKFKLHISASHNISNLHLAALAIRLV
jgi:hypothetical protein